MIHQLKCEKEYFQAIINGDKTFEVRKNDRGFQTGDFLALNELSLTKIGETGRCLIVEIIYILDNSNFCKDGMVIMSIRPCAIKRIGSLTPEIDYRLETIPVYGEEC